MFSPIQILSTWIAFAFGDRKFYHTGVRRNNCGARPDRLPGRDSDSAARDLRQRSKPGGVIIYTVFSEDHRLHDPAGELHRGRVLPYHESPKRANLIFEAVSAAKLGDIVEPKDFGLEPLLRVHGEEYIKFLHSAYELWTAANLSGDAVPHVWRGRSLRDVIPTSIVGKLGYYSFDAATPINAGTSAAITSAANVALTAASLLQQGQRSVFGLTRPPGHHASHNVYGGYCFLNNAAIAAEWLLDSGAERVAILDVDYHHGNGTQSIFYDRSDVLFVSLHADPAHAFPYFLGYADEQGTKEGEGYNLNYPLPEGTDWNQYKALLSEALDRIAEFAPAFIVLSLGVDTYDGDPISEFAFQHDDFTRMSELLASLDIPTVLLMEGGYAVEALGQNVVNVLAAFK